MSERLAPVLVVNRLRVEITGDVDVVDEVSFAVRPGEVLAVVGESGCGKTSTALALLGHARRGTRIASGSVILGGEDILHLSPRTLRLARGARISYVPQDPTASLNPRQRIGAQIAEVLRVHRTGGAAAAQVVRELVDQVRLPPGEAFLRRFPFELSGGQQQRVAIAMALACKPLIIVLDEPTTGLDVTTQARILDLLRGLSAETATAFVYVTHDLAVVDTIADHIAVMYAGRIVESGTREHVFRRPAHPYTSLLLAAVPRLSARRQVRGIPGTAPAPHRRPVGCYFAPRCPLVVEECRRAFPPEVTVAPDHVTRCWRATEVMVTNRTAPQQQAVMAASPTPLLGVVDLVASYGQGGRRHAVLHSVSLAVNPGECLAIVGESGSGKTTLGRCVVGLHRPDAGVLTLKGRPLAPFTTQRRHSEQQAIQIIFQNPERSLNPRESVGEAIARPLRLFDKAVGMARRQQIARLLDQVRLPQSVLERYPRELSGGERQRVAIARALAARPLLLVCDEITSALDVSIQAAIVEVLDNLCHEGLTLFFITHNLALVNAVADRVLVLEAGYVREVGETARVIGQPTHPYTRELLTAAPDLG